MSVLVVIDGDDAAVRSGAISGYESQRSAARRGARGVLVGRAVVLVAAEDRVVQIVVRDRVKLGGAHVAADEAPDARGVVVGVDQAVDAAVVGVDEVSIGVDL